ncbi:hypothetical protein [Anaerocolumna sp.]|uniref:hypothetical protein n=1 Tax=Anaerocolumna sp. TaxID=2041569 RepID=UPI0028A8BCB2|nr:hypothetical protein [Anaerocolumna sp.]
MNAVEAIELGKEKVRKGYVSSHINDLNDKVFEILGYTEADYYGTEEIDSLKSKFDNDNDLYEVKFYQYIDNELVECSFEKAISTLEYEEDNIFIFSQREDDKRQHYVTIIINND